MLGTVVLENVSHTGVECTYWDYFQMLILHIRYTSEYFWHQDGVCKIDSINNVHVHCNVGTCHLDGGLSISFWITMRVCGTKEETKALATQTIALGQSNCRFRSDHGICCQ